MSAMRIERDFLNTETLNLAELHAHSLLYTPREARFDRITRIACRALDVPVATLGFVQDGMLWFKSCVGWNCQQLPAEGTFCEYVVASDQILVIEDAAADERFANSPLVTAEPHFRFYAGVPLRAAGDVCVGTLALFDTSPRFRSASLLQTLRDLGGIVQKELVTVDLRNSYNQWIRRMNVRRRRLCLDPVTNLWNETLALELATGTLAQAADERRSVGIGVLEIGFGGNTATESAEHSLRLIAELLVSSLPVQDIACRGPGGEFLLIVDNASPARLKDIARRLFQRLVEFRAEHRVPDDFSFHFGGVVCGHRDGETAEALFRTARRALQASRERGDGGIAIAGARLDA